VLDDGRSERPLVVRDRLVVGRDPSCDVSDADPRLSRRHAEFLMTPRGLVVRDLESRNGVRLNGRIVREALLEPGDLVEMAHLSLRFEDDAHQNPADRAFPADPPRPVEGVRVKDGFEDDRTRLVNAPSPESMAETGEESTSTARDFGDVTLRIPAMAADASPRARRFGVIDLVASRWGIVVLAQGIGLAMLVFAITALPLLNWAAGTAEPVRPGLVARLLAAPFVASVVGGALVASLIARTTARGLKSS
jgi:hypothetical protein